MSSDLTLAILVIAINKKPENDRKKTTSPSRERIL